MTSEPMSDERLAEIKRRHQQSKRGQVVTVYGQAELFREWLDSAAADEAALLADNERLRAREAALVAQNEQAMKIVMALDVLGWDAFIGRELWGQARALLAATEPTDASTAERE